MIDLVKNNIDSNDILSANTEINSVISVVPESTNDFNSSINDATHNNAFCLDILDATFASVNKSVPGDNENNNQNK